MSKKEMEKGKQIERLIDTLSDQFRDSLIEQIGVERITDVREIDALIIEVNIMLKSLDEDNKPGKTLSKVTSRTYYPIANLIDDDEQGQPQQ